MLNVFPSIQDWCRRGLCLSVALLSLLAGVRPLYAEELVLPGFAPLRTAGTSVTLGGGRTYTWDHSYVPMTMTAGGRPLATALTIGATINGRETELRPSEITVLDQSASATTIRARGALATAQIDVTTRIEYDGLAMGQLTLTADSPLTIDALEFRVTLVATADTRLMRWDIPTYRKNIRKFPLSTPQYTGPFQEILGLTDGSRSFWWFTDDANRWLSQASNTTSVEMQGDQVVLRQRLAGGTVTPEEPGTLTFNLLTTPIRDGAPWRAPAQRIARRVTAEEGKGAGLQLWWPDAFPHQALPYAEWPTGVTQEITPEDRRRYPGIAGTRALLKEANDAGLTRLPYFSAHAPSLYDPVVQAHRAEWEVLPPFIIKPGADAPFTSPLERPWLSLRAPGLIEHLVSRFDQVIDTLGIEGLYFDQGAPMSSQHPAHGAWRESARRVHGTLDILAMRRYFKSLAELFHRKGKAGHLIVHMSSVPIIPAYSFVTALVQGEEFLLDLKQTDYIGSVPLDVVRAQYAPGQYGIGSIWLDQFWSHRLPGNPAARYANQEQWLNSIEHLTAWRNYMTLVLLHDVQAWSFAPVRDRQAIATVLNDFGVASAKFLGYWEAPLGPPGSLGTPDMAASLYRQDGQAKTLIVAANLGTRAGTFALPSVCRAFESPCPQPLRYRVHGLGASNWLPLTSERLELRIPARDFRLVELAAAEPTATPASRPTGRTKTVRP